MEKEVESLAIPESKVGKYFNLMKEDCTPSEAAAICLAIFATISKAILCPGQSIEEAAEDAKQMIATMRIITDVWDENAKH